jgi:hypothetical protein
VQPDAPGKNSGCDCDERNGPDIIYGCAVLYNVVCSRTVITRALQAPAKVGGLAIESPCNFSVQESRTPPDKVAILK